jgi:aminoglycoside phosphotransferase (APT) family kinase protein
MRHDPISGGAAWRWNVTLSDELARVIGAPVGELRRLSGGASRETYAFESGGRALILRLGTPGPPGLGVPVLREAELMRAAAAAGVPTPEIVASGGGDAEGGTGGPLDAGFVVMAHVEGETIPRRILRDETLAAARTRLAAQCGRILAAVHRMAAPGGLSCTDPLETWPALLTATGEPHPALELGLRWLARNRPPTARTTVVHGDFRNGNLIVGSDGIRAVLDWELAHLGDPIEDLGWLCVRAWRFGSSLPVGGFGSYEQLVTAYEEAGGGPVDPEALRWWEIFGVVKWGVICVMQAQRHLTGGERSIELATIGRRACENEWDLLHLLP